jgi:hypothetical protein
VHSPLTKLVDALGLPQEHDLHLFSLRMLIDE